MEDRDENDGLPKTEEPASEKVLILRQVCGTNEFNSIY
jgi:hypothetical protein